MKYCLFGGSCAAILAIVLILIGFVAFNTPALLVIGFLIFFIDVCFMACVNHKITNTVRMMLCTATAYENQVYKDRLPPVRWIVEEWKLITTTVHSGGRRGGASTSRNTQTFFDLYVEVGAQTVQPQTVVIQHVYGAPQPGGYGPQYGQPPAGYGPPPAGGYGPPPAGYPSSPPVGYPPAGYPPQQWSPNHSPQQSQQYYGQPPAAGQQWPSQPPEAAPAYNREDPLGTATSENDTGSTKLLSSSQQSDA